MAQVFLSYRQIDDDHKSRVRDFATQLVDAGIEVILDQFFLDANPAGPNDGWDKWSSDSALNSEYVIIIGSQAWFDCFEKKQTPGTGLGAACEADDLRHRIYEAGGVISNIRVVLFDDNDSEFIPGKLKRYHRFHAERDIENIKSWLGSKPKTPQQLSTSIPHNLPRLQPFFGREEELQKIKDVLDPEDRSWGTSIYGSGGMGKTSLAIRTALEVSPNDFNRIVFVSLKSRELDDDGETDQSGFLTSGLLELFNELADELGLEDISKAPEEHKPKLLLYSLREQRTLLILDNLESLVKEDRKKISAFVRKLPPGCKAILTSRERIGTVADELMLGKLTEEAALNTIEELGKHNPAIANTSKAERLELYEVTQGIPLLLRWTAGQIGRGTCLTMKEAIDYLRSCPEGNDALEFIFGHLAENFTEEDTKVLCTLSYFTLPAKVQHIADIIEYTNKKVNDILHRLTNLSLAVQSKDEETYTLIPLVGDFLRSKKENIITETALTLTEKIYDLVIECGGGSENYESFPILNEAWPSIVAAIPIFLKGQNNILQDVCKALDTFLNFTGRWDERLALALDAEKKALLDNDFYSAGWRIYNAGSVYIRRGLGRKCVGCAHKASSYWDNAKAGNREISLAIRLKGKGHELSKDFDKAITTYNKSLEMSRQIEAKSQDVAMTLNDLASAKNRLGDLQGSEKNIKEALEIANDINYFEGRVTYTTNLAILSLNNDNEKAENLARKALRLAQDLHREELIGKNYIVLAQALLRQNKKSDALPYAQLAIDIFTKLGVSEVTKALEVLKMCEEE